MPKRNISNPATKESTKESSVQVEGRGGKDDYR